jgi:hypothetical protein
MDAPFQPGWLNMLKGATIKSLYIGNVACDLSDIQALSGLPNLEWLQVSGAGINGDGLSKSLAACRVRTLLLNDNPIEDEAIKAIANCESIEEISLSGTNVTGTSLVVLAKMPRLRKIDLRRTRIPRVQVERLRQLRPDLEVKVSGMR